MKKKLNSILLIDDDEATNYIHRIIIQDHGCCENIIFKYDGEAALNYLNSPTEKGFPNPDIIFLDINMPKLDGWGFLEEYQASSLGQDAKIIVMLTTSPNQLDKERAERIDIISEFRNKPLTSKMLDELIEKYFNEEISAPQQTTIAD
ncbi:MAG: response regulator [Bacteroidota bacterium]